MNLTSPAKPPLPSLPARPRLVFRVGFAGRRELSPQERQHLSTALDEVLRTLGAELSHIAPGTPTCPKHPKPPVAAYYSNKVPLLRLITGLCEGADSLAAEALGRLSQGWLEKELAAVLPFQTDIYRESRPEEFRPIFDQQLASCAWVLELDGLHEKPVPDTERAKRRRGRAYRAQSAFLLRQSDLIIAAADPSVPGKAGGTLETVREAQHFELPVIFIHTGTGRVYLVEPRDDLESMLADEAPAPPKRDESLQKWLRQLTADADSGLNPEDHAGKKNRERGESLLREYFDSPAMPSRCAQGDRIECWREIAWTWWQQRFDCQRRPWTKRLLSRVCKRLWQRPLKQPATTPVETEDSFASHRERARQLNYHYSGLYRGAFLLNYAFAVLAVALAAVSLVILGSASHTPTGEGMVKLASSAMEHLGKAQSPAAAHHGSHHQVLLFMAAAKLLILLFITINTRRANKEAWNDRAVDYRYLAERLRGMMFLPIVGSHQPPAASPPQFASRVVRQSYVDWLFDALVRAVSPQFLASPKIHLIQHGKESTTVALKVDAGAALQRVWKGWIEEQITYHEKNTRVMHRMHETIETASRVLGTLVILIVGADLLFVAAEILHEWQKQHPDSFHWSWLNNVQDLKPYIPWLVCTATILPAIVAALSGMRFQSECQRLSERSAVMRVMLGGRTVSDKREAHGPRKAIFRTCWLAMRHLLGCPPACPFIQANGGRWQQASELHQRIQTKASCPDDIGSWSHDVLRLTELVATDFVQETAEWSVLYAKEVSDPG